MMLNYKRLFSFAFRPFFLLLGGYALVVIPAWALYLAGVLDWPAGLPSRLRHAHKLLFGFGGAAIAGFLLTAVATSSPPSLP